jgi:O-antigen/teichoic acid export membrane protein
MNKSGPPISVLGGISWTALNLLVARGSIVAAVPLILHGLGQNLYGAWVLAGTIIMSQGLVDFGVGAAATRLIAVAAAHRSRSDVLGVLARAGSIYGALSVAGGGLLVLNAHALVGLIPSLRGAAAPQAVQLVFYLAAAFAITNAVSLLASVVEGCGRVDLSAKCQALGWLFYVPCLLAGLRLGLRVHAVGLSWLIVYCVQASLLGKAAAKEVGLLPRREPSRIRLRALISLGGWWQISSWADFAAFQVPRLIAGALLSSGALLQLDLALRFAQLAVFPFFASYPVLLPLATHAEAGPGRPSFIRLISTWQRRAAVGAILVSILMAFLARPAIAAWTGTTLSFVDPAVCIPLLVGVIAHASTGVLTTALLAIGRIGLVVRYKALQFIMAIAFVVSAKGLGVRGFAAAAASAFVVPAAIFVWQSSRLLGIETFGHNHDAGGRLIGSIAVCAVVPGTTLAVTSMFTSAVWPTLLTSGAAGAISIACAAWLHGVRRASFGAILLRRGSLTIPVSAAEPAKEPSGDS